MSELKILYNHHLVIKHFASKGKKGKGNDEGLTSTPNGFELKNINNYSYKNHHLVINDITFKTKEDRKRKRDEALSNGKNEA